MGGYRILLFMRRHSILSPGLLSIVALCAIGSVAITSEVEREADGWAQVRPGFYAGPTSNIVQPFRVEHHFLSRIDIWAYIDGGDAEAVGDVLVRIIPAGAETPIRESRIEVRHKEHVGETVEIAFAPIPHTRGQQYALELQVLSGPTPYVFVGITGSDLISAGQVSINGNASWAHLDLAMRPYWVGRGGNLLKQLIRTEPWRAFVIVEIVLWVFVVAFATSALWSMRATQCWRSVVWNSARRGAQLTAGIAVCALALLLILSAFPHI